MDCRRFLLLTVALAEAWGADIDSSALLSRVQSRVRDNARRTPRYVCRQQIERQDYAISKGTIRACGTLREKGLPRVSGQLSLMSSDRAKLDVMQAGGAELFSWPNGRRFDVDEPAVLLGGFAGSGDFANYVISIFTLDGVTFEYMGACEVPSCVRYSYEVPREASHHEVKNTLSEAIVGYQGTFDVDPESADLLQVIVVLNDLQNLISTACDLRTRIIYTRVNMDASEFTIPKSTEKEYLARDGSYFTNRVSYEGCRQYTAESSLSFGDDSPRIPADEKTVSPEALVENGLELQLRLASKIDSESAYAGDSLEATSVRPVRDTRGGMVPPGTVFRGHLAQVEKVYVPRREVVFAIRFEAIVLNGAPVPISLNPIGKMDQRGRMIVRIQGPRGILDKGFISRWHVQSPAR